MPATRSKSERKVERIGVREGRRLALARAGLLKPSWTELPARARERGRGAHEAAHAIIERFGYLQLDTVSVAGARSHSLVLLSRLEGADAALGEELLRPGAPIFEYWGHEASWLPLALYPVFAFRRRAFRRHPWWGDVVGKHREVARALMRRIREEGPLRSADMEGPGGRGWWDFKIQKRVATGLWSSGELAIRERVGFQRSYDLPERVIPRDVLEAAVPRPRALEALIERALSGHGWASTGTIAATWRLRNMRSDLDRALRRLEAKGTILRCTLDHHGGRPVPGWIRPSDLELAARLVRVRPRSDRGVLLSPFDPVLWNRPRVARLFGFDQVLEIFKPKPARTYGYYCLPVLAGESLVARVDLKAARSAGRVEMLSCRFESTGTDRPGSADEGEAVRTALARYVRALGFDPSAAPCPRGARA